MKSLPRILTSLLSTAMLLNASPALAQDSFFDIDYGFSGEPIPTADGRFLVDSFFDVNLDIDVCDPCDAIRNEIDRVMAEIEGLQTDLGMLDELMTALETDMAETDQQLEDAQERLDEFNDPQDFVESEGRRYDSSDHAAMQRRSGNLWDAYQAGDLTAQEYSAEIAKPFDDPDVQRELEKLKKEIRKEMEKQIKDLKKTKADQEKKHQEWDTLGQEMTAELDALEAELAELQQALEACLKLCAEPKPEDGLVPGFFGTPIPGPGFLDGLLGGLFGPPPILPPLPPLPDPSGDDIPTELLPMGLSGPPMLPLPDPLGLPTDLPPPTCLLCDPIREQIAETEQSLALLEWDQLLADLMVELLYDEKANRQQRKDQLEQELDRLQNPPGYVESEGRRYDSTDHAAMKVRNARLWGEYKAGRLSADELSSEWEKDFDDPDVQEELDDIKEQLEDELDDQIDELEDQLEELDEEIEELNDELVDLAGKIAAHKKVLEFLYQDLSECERKCVQPPASDSVFIPDFDDLIRDIGETLRTAVGEIETSQSGDDEAEDEVGEEDDMDDIDDVEEEEEGEVQSDGFVCKIPLVRGVFCKNDNDTYPVETAPEAENVVGEGVTEADEDDMDGVGRKGGFLCEAFGLFCGEKNDEPTYEYDDLRRCVRQSDDKDCLKFDSDNNNLFDERDLNLFDFALHGPNDLIIPIDPSGLDGNDGLSFDDYDRLDSCFKSPSSCGGLGITLPPSDVLIGAPSGLSGNDFLLQGGPAGNDVIIGGPVPDDLININGGSNDILFGGPGTLPDGLIGPQGDDIIGGPPSLDLFGENGNDLIGDPPPPPTQSEPNVQNDPQVKQVVEAAVRRYLQQNPLGECEKLQVQVSRVRVGNTVRYTVRITRIRDESLCPPPVAQCPSQTSYESVGTPSTADCTATCQNNGAGCTVIETLPDGRTCILCAPPEDDIDLGCQYDSDCDDGDECTDDRCNRTTGECTNILREGCNDPVCGDGVKQPSEQCEGDNDSACRANEVCNEECLCEPKPVPKAECPDFAHSTMAACNEACSGDCRSQKYEDADCYFCVPKDEPVKVSCDRPYMEKPECDKSCSNGFCSKNYTTSSGTECFSCIEDPDPVCGDGNVDPGEQCDDGNTRNGDGCDAECQNEPEDTGSLCPDGTTDNLSACQSQCGAQGGTCVDEDQTGCYSCVVVNCPAGTSKECPRSCGNGCEVVGEQYGVSCYQCKQSCEDVCAQNGYGGPNTDHSSAILSELNGYSCVSGANISIQTATIGSCSCIGEYSLSVDQTPPVCTGTPCGDVTCGSSSTCQEGDTTITVNCNWGGWEKIQKHQFRPIIGN